MATDSALEQEFRPRPALQNRLVASLLLAAVAVVVVKAAWVSDDAYITFRTIDNFYAGYGLRWNVVERVQAYTHPLWMLLVGAAYGVTREPYYTSLVLSVLVTISAVYLLYTRLASSMMAGVFAACILLLSKAFVEYSTSGLENPLSHLLIVVFVLICWRAPFTRVSVAWLSLTASLLLLNRLDLALLVAPALAVRIWKTPHRRTAITAAASGFLPLIAWEVFSLIYYGVPFPNTAYAKLNTGTPSSELAQQGMFYLFESAGSDPLTMTAIVTACLAAWRLPRWQGWPLAIGILLYLAYVVRIGGDFMSGRFLTAPLVASALMLARIEWPIGGLQWSVPIAVAGVAGLIAQYPPVLTGIDYGYEAGQHRAIAPTGVTDERQFYYWSTGVMRAFRGVPVPDQEWAHEGRQERSGPPITVRGAIGFYGYFVGPSVHVIDYHALADPLLARLPASSRWRVGHFSRRLPGGYEESVRSDEIRLDDPRLAEYYRTLRLVTRAPIFDGERLRTVVAFNLGRYEYLLNRYALGELSANDVADRKADGTPWDAPGTHIMPERGIRIDLDGPQRARFIDLSVSGNDYYNIRFLLDDRDVAEARLRPDPVHDGSLSPTLLRIPNEAGDFDAVAIAGREGDFRYSLGHLRLIP